MFLQKVENRDIHVHYGGNYLGIQRFELLYEDLVDKVYLYLYRTCVCLSTLSYVWCFKS